MEPIKADEIPADLDDSSDAEIKATPVGAPQGMPGRRRPVVGGAFCGPLTPRRGDSDYIPGLPQQIPRHLNRSTPVNAPAPQSPLPEDDIPMAEPL